MLNSGCTLYSGITYRNVRKNHFGDKKRDYTRYETSELQIFSCVIGAFTNIQLHMHVTPRSRPKTTMCANNNERESNPLHVAQQPVFQPPRQPPSFCVVVECEVYMFYLKYILKSTQAEAGIQAAGAAESTTPEDKEERIICREGGAANRMLKIHLPEE
ncbi:hypothetical protein SFRURICE_004742 [Spodoptera frugiperda]|uniref:SFRICE_025459 n=1 Tax=Spodoptera frugiperda TaxID=7108 RepID=A0A2H1VHX5_SPOFR|nr:hypothetical protein SFRURICE_004742 [Spodoptera frugiperda]